MYVADELIAYAVTAFREAVATTLAHSSHTCTTAVLAAGRAAAFAQMLEAIGITDEEIWGPTLPGQVADAVADVEGLDTTGALNMFRGVPQNASAPLVTVTRTVDQPPPITAGEVDTFDVDAFLSSVIDRPADNEGDR